MNVRHSMYRMVFILIVFPFLMFSLLITQIYSAKLERVIIESLSAVSNAQVSEMTNFCEQQNDYLVLLGNMDMSRAAMRGNLNPEMMQYLNNMLYAQAKTINGMHTLTIMDKNHRVVACSEMHKDFANEGIGHLLHSMGDASFYISDVLINEQNQKTLVAIARIEENGELLGYTLEEISLNFYAKIREQAELWNGSTFYLLDGNRQIISAGTADEDRESFITSAKEREDYNKKYSAIDFEQVPKGSFQYKLGESNYITYYSDVAYTNWRVLLTVNLSNYQAQKTVYFILALFMIALCIVLAIWISAFASKRIIRPIKSISNTLKAIQKEQDYSLRIKVERQDEMGVLGTEINELVNFIETEDLYKKQQQRLLQEKAEQDALTKVLNKERINQYFQEALDRHRSAGTAIAVLFIDVDDFKDFNTNYGHNVGDQVLLFLTALLTRETGGTVGRVGGDEFLVIIENPVSEKVLDMCLKNVEEAARSRFMVRGSGTCLPVFCSIGAIYIDFSHPELQLLTPEQMTDIADTVMYQVKNNGKGGHMILDYKDGMENLKK